MYRAPSTFCSLSFARCSEFAWHWPMMTGMRECGIHVRCARPLSTIYEGAILIFSEDGLRSPPFAFYVICWRELVLAKEVTGQICAPISNSNLRRRQRNGIKLLQGLNNRRDQKSPHNGGDNTEHWC